ncbi:MAG TPA: flavin reductase [Bacteroidales bacterium]|nr:flavin reductase [Bacteroidales bacterium]HQI71402.1 flavin reductase [Bacteroidales bacterium]
MINFEAFFSITYGLYIVCSGDKEFGNGYISNTVFQVTSEPPRFATCCNKNNFTAEIMKIKGNFSVSILSTDTSSEIFSKFGYRCGRDFNKFEGLSINYGETGVPIVLNDSIAFLECEIVQTIDLGTHLMFIGDLVQADAIDFTKEPITYRYYRQVKKGLSPKNAPTYIDKSKLEKISTTENQKKYKCCVCGYIYDDNVEAIKFNELPDDWVCPLCGAGKDAFIEVLPPNNINL